MSTSKLRLAAIAKQIREQTYTPKIYASHRELYFPWFFNYQERLPDWFGPNLMRTFGVGWEPGMARPLRINPGTGEPCTIPERVGLYLKEKFYEYPWVTLMYVITLPCLAFMFILGEDPNNPVGYDPITQPGYKYPAFAFRPGYSVQLFHKADNKDYMIKKSMWEAPPK
eukprot:gb/GEZN01018142.1/.p1 GENE.gb/GEZN01018142.1/~~gb/GEZN01018142.1/.p1  ORF type:complete len:169 (-),score=15.11 gb/GEZN01018142.1/:193-699(-)